MRRAAVWWLLVILSCAFGVHAGAQDTPEDERYTRAIQAAIEAYNADAYAVAREHFLEAHALRPSARTWRGLGTTAFELKVYEDAVRELTFALEDQRNALSEALRAETELTLRVARRRLGEGTQREDETASVRSELRAEDARIAPQRSQPPPTAAVGLGAARVTAIVLGSVGVAALAAGIGAGLQSMIKGRERDRLCPAAQQPLCNPEAQRAADAAITAGDISTVTFIAAGTLLTTSLVLWLAGGPAETAPTQLAIGPTSIALTGTF
jgi:tetratricopeptide (TPR) repeat protein